MSRRLMLSVIAGVMLLSAPGNSQPGRNSWNHYRVGMNGRIRLPDGGDTTREGTSTSRWIIVDFKMRDDGSIEAPLSMENDTLTGFCGSVQLQIRNAANQILDSFHSNTYCIGGKSPTGGGPNHSAGYIPWNVKTTPENAKAYVNLFIVPEAYEDKTLTDIIGVVKTAADVVVTLIAVLP